MSAILIENGTLIDGTEAEARPLDALFIDGDEIIAIGPAAEEAASSRDDVARIDASGCTVMPGLIDAHCHVTFAEPQSNDELFFHRREGLAALVATQSVKKLLLAGVTGFFDADVLFNLGVDLRDAIEAGVIEGPRMATGGNALLTAVGGTAGLLIPDEGIRGYAKIVNTRDEMITSTRRQIKSGVDWIKIHATGLIPRQKAQGEIQVWTLDELRTVCDTAHALGIPVVAHCRNASSTRDAAKAGVDMILHATNMDDEALAAVVEHRVPITPTLTFQANLADFGHKVGATPELIDLFRREIDDSSSWLRKAYDQGVPLVSGSESGFSLTPYGHWHAREMEVFVKHLGLTPHEAIRTATSEGARALKMDGEIGVVAEGKKADVIVVDGDPLQDIRVLGDRSRLRAVVSKGRSVDLSQPWPTRSPLPGEKIGVWSQQPLTWDRANDLGPTD
ncbi:MAG: amidohydrolase family protein [Actinomycetota bacterium]|nr:amidohydrolase family protein [Actinomycetota bacterium]